MVQKNKKSYAVGVADKPLIGSTIGDFFDHITATYPDNEAVVSCHQDVRLTYSQLKERVDEFAKGLMHLGVKKGDRVGIWSTNNLEWLITQLATPKIGAILVSLNPSYQIPELEYALKRSGVSVLILSPGTKYADYIEMVRKLVPEAPTTTKGKTLESKALPLLRQLVTIGSTKLASAYTTDEVTELGGELSDSELATRQCSLEFDEPVNIQYTSGTTGSPKGATLTHHNVLNNSFMIAEILRITDKDRLCVPVPFYHCFGMVLSNLLCLTHGATIVLPGDQFDAGKVLKAIQDERCTAVHGVPTMFIAELEHPDFSKYNLSSLRTGVMAGSPCPIEVMKRVIGEMGIKDITICYGMTETSPVSFQTRVDDPIELRVSTVGTPHPWVEAKIIDKETGKLLPIGEAGEICTRGYVVMAGYWERPDWTKEAIDEHGWMHTGDLGVMDERGYVNIVGRTKDMVCRGGENIYPREIEEVLYQHEKIVDAQVIGVPSIKYGEELMAWIILKPGQTATTDEIKAFCQERLAYYRVPAYIKVVEEFPMTVTGKIQKFKMRQTAIKELGLQKAARIKTA